jgi:hypothetical protein
VRTLTPRYRAAPARRKYPTGAFAFFSFSFTGHLSVWGFALIRTGRLTRPQGQITSSQSTLQHPPAYRERHQYTTRRRVTPPPLRSRPAGASHPSRRLRSHPPRRARRPARRFAPLPCALIELPVHDNLQRHADSEVPAGRPFGSTCHRSLRLTGRLSRSGTILQRRFVPSLAIVNGTHPHRCSEFRKDSAAS